MYDQLSFIQEIHKKSDISFDILCDFSLADENSRSQNHHSNYYTSLYITYFNPSVFLQTAVFQKYLTMWNAYFFWEITTEFHLNINHDSVAVSDVRLFVMKFICLTNVSKVI